MNAICNILDVLFRKHKAPVLAVNHAEKFSSASHRCSSYSARELEVTKRFRIVSLYQYSMNLVFMRLRSKTAFGHIGIDEAS